MLGGKLRYVCLQIIYFGILLNLIRVFNVENVECNVETVIMLITGAVIFMSKDTQYKIKVKTQLYSNL